MANEDITSREGQALYRLVILLNGTLKVVVTRLEELSGHKVLNSEYLKELKRLTDKIESEIGSK
jgi:hypothetical protein